MLTFNAGQTYLAKLSHSEKTPPKQVVILEIIGQGENKKVRLRLDGEERRLYIHRSTNAEGDYEYIRLGQWTCSAHWVSEHQDSTEPTIDLIARIWRKHSNLCFTEFIGRAVDTEYDLEGMSDDQLIKALTDYYGETTD